MKGHNYGICRKCAEIHQHPSVVNPQTGPHISQALRGKPKSEEHRRKLSRPKSAETKRKISLARMGRRHVNLLKIAALVFTDVESAWLACGIDTDGSLRSARYRYSRADGSYSYDGWRHDIRWYNSNLPYLEHVAELVGEPIRNQLPHPSRWGRKPMYYVSVKATVKVHSLLRQAVPFLIIKRQHAQDIVASIEQRYPHLCVSS